ncbi:MAG: hypothetical protein JRE71_16040 [Deltaproteobacteria bacterium]|nr:hypothetical protein [Deltaproteobacteria bacterium]
MASPERVHVHNHDQISTVNGGYTVVLALILLVAATSVSIAAEPNEDKAKDSTGTNPINFTNDFRIYMELQGLNAGKNSGGQMMTFEYRKPIGDDWQVRTRLRGVSRSLDVDADGRSETTTGVGDFDVRLLTIPHLAKTWAVATGIEVTLDTATDDLLGEGKWLLGPQVFLVSFSPFGIPGTLFAPAYQHVFHVAGDGDRADVNRSLIDLFIVWISPDKKNWIVVDPQIIIDHENDEEYSLVDVELGQMMFGGLSSYIRPSVGIGADRPLDWSAELGFKVIWR